MKIHNIQVFGNHSFHSDFFANNIELISKGHIKPTILKLLLEMCDIAYFGIDAK